MKSQFESTITQKIVDAQAQLLPELTRRDIWIPTVSKEKAIAVIGMRRAGKTSFLWQLLADRHRAGAPREGLLYFSFEDERLAGMTAQDLHLVLEAYYRLNPEWRDKQRASLFLDEIQIIPGWEAFARRVLDTENVELFLSGSSARMLSREVATNMRGRALEALVTPFSFAEVLRHSQREPHKPLTRLTKADRSQLDHDLLSYLEQGGFPEAQGLDARNRQALMRNYVDVVLLRDVLERHNVSQPQVLRWLVQQLLGNPAGAFSINKFHADLKSRGTAVGKETLHQLLAHLEDTFLISHVNIASSSPRQQQVNPRKIYPVDTALMSLFSANGKANTGHALKTIVFHALKRLGAEVTYVRTANGFEVDFYAKVADGQEMLVQVCADISSAKTLEREIRALEDAHNTWPTAKMLLVVLYAPLQVELPQNIELCLASQWLLEIAHEALN